MAGEESIGHSSSGSPEDIARFLIQNQLFRGSDPTIVSRISPHLRATTLPAKSTIIRTGNADQIFGILVSGKVSIRTLNSANGSVLSQEDIAPGDCFGEVAALLAVPQPNEVYAEDDCLVILFPKEVFAQLITKVTPFVYAISRRVASRYVESLVVAPRRSLSFPGESLPPSPIAAATLPGMSPTAVTGGIPFVRASSYTISEQLAALVPSKLIQQARLLPLELKGRTLLVGMVDPFSTSSVNELKRVLNSIVPEIVAISQDDFNEMFLKLKLDPQAKAKGVKPIPFESLTFDGQDQEREADKAGRVMGDEVVQLASKIVAAAIERGASDVHIEGDAAGVRVRFRVGGSLLDWGQYIAPSFSKGLVARFKVLAGLDITERRLPQDGRIGVKIEKREIDLRLSTLPASRGEKVVLRLFEGTSMLRPLEQIFIDPTGLAAIRAALDRPYGAIIVAGPTGSGKSSTLYASLNERKRARPDSNIIMVEDPIEYRLQGVTQVQVNHGVELTFSRILRAMMRQDPDVIMVGEIRDADTAHLALEAAMTGHLMFSSVHGNNTLSVLQRFENLGCNRAMLSQSLAIVVVQRLARKMCPHCVISEPPPAVLFESLVARGLVEKTTGNVSLGRSVGCQACNQTGIQGRVAVMEIMTFSDAIRHGLMADYPLSEIESFALQGNDLIPFRRYAAGLMARNVLSATEALLVVA